MTDFKNASREEWRAYTGSRSLEAVIMASRLGLRVGGAVTMDVNPGLLSQVLLDSTRVEYDPIESWLDYTTALSYGGIFIPYHIFAQLSDCKPLLQISRRYRRFQTCLMAALLRQGCKLSQSVDTIVSSIQPLVPDISLNEVMVLSTMCVLKDIRFHVSVLKRPGVYPPSPLEKAMWKAAKQDKDVYYDLISAYNNKCPMWLLCFRRSFRGFDA